MGTFGFLLPLWVFDGTVLADLTRSLVSVVSD